MKRETANNTDNCHDIIMSEDYVDLIVDTTTKNIEEIAEELGAQCYQQLSDGIGMVYVPVNKEQCDDFYLQTEYMSIPNIYGLSSVRVLEDAGIKEVIDNKALDLTGKGILIGVIDTGIDYTHQAFRSENNHTRIVSIWDQTIKGKPPERFMYGTEYTQEDINRALESDNPYSIVSSTDEIGHGTYVAGIAAGNPNESYDFQGVAPNAELVIVKLKQAKKCLKKFYKTKIDAIAFQTNNILDGCNYLLDKAEESGRPIVILFTGESNYGSREGTVLLEEVFAEYGNSNGVIIVLVAGNEANASHHFLGLLSEKKKAINVEFNIAEGQRGLYMVLWGAIADKLTVELISPSGTTTGIIPFRSREWQQINLFLEETVIDVRYDFIEERSSGQTVAVRLSNPTPGLWTMIVYGDIIINGEFNVWLPISSFIEKNTAFIRPNPYITIVNPSTNEGTITVGVYNDNTDSIYLPSGRGFTRNEKVKPDFVAPGVDVLGPFPNNTYGVMSGTSVGAAITAGASALLLEWGIVKGNNTTINTTTMNTYFIRGARRREGINYPNREWGYGQLDLFRTFEVIRLS